MNPPPENSHAPKHPVAWMRARVDGARAKAARINAPGSVSPKRQLDFSAFSSPPPSPIKRIRVIGRGGGVTTRMLVGWMVAVGFGLPTLMISALVAGFAGNRALAVVYWVMWAAVGLGAIALFMLDKAISRQSGVLVHPHSSRVEAFAKANNFTYGPFAISWPGSALVPARGGGGIAEGLTGTHVLPFRLGSVGVFERADNPPVFSGWAFLDITLPRELPHFFLVPESRAAGDTVGDTWGFETSVLELEGDFNRSFTLHVASGYETDSLYVLTPDLMAALVDEAGDFFLESISNRLVVMSNTPFVGGGEAVYRRLFTILETVGVQAFEQVQRYTDARGVPAARVSVGRLRDIARPLLIIAGSLIALVVVPLIAVGALLP